MKKIAILRCLITSASCTGSGCLRAMYDREQHFARYDGEEVRLVGMWTCNGCGASTLENQDGIRKKIERMKILQPDVLHLSKCTHKKNAQGDGKHLCPKIKAIAEELAACGIAIEDGTH